MASREDDVEVEACPDLSDMRRVGGVRLRVVSLSQDSDGVTVDLTPPRAHRLVERILSALFQTGAMRGTI